MDFMKLLGSVLALFCYQSSAAKLFSGQRICRRGTERPCYKIAYFQDSGRRVAFEEAQGACRGDGGELLSVETENEQRLVERFLKELRAGDGDFWIGLRRNQARPSAGANCQEQYHWLDGSKASFRNWYWDEPSCGFEVCVVMYHQPSAPPGMGGPYMFQWNDDNCNTKNNFICKYSQETQAVSTSAGNLTLTDAPSLPLQPNSPLVPMEEEKMNVVVSESAENSLNITYIILPTIPLLLLLLVATGVFCFKLVARRRKEWVDPCPKEPGYWVPAGGCSSPSPDVYQVLSKQRDTDLAGTRPDARNTSFRPSSPDTPSGDYDNLTARDTESDFVTLASAESGFVTNDIYEACQGRGRPSREAGWVENEIYGY
ncbi:hypothetical protein MATL_G00123740 [Megalops atlanticus]|uniref:C-type lectin domain-containing protein n=1 Tax=Megalops atlanticus TaxID=7932 RepID=A0A9D3PZ43_MEGAT|nr:hypothetical protein MATL_G00123740 [Megalops atlanticus]